MRGNELLDKMELIDPAYLEAAEAKPKKKKHGWSKWGALAACLCLATAIAFAVVHPWETGAIPAPNPTGTTEPDKYPPDNTVPGLTPDGPDSGNRFPFVFNDVDEAPVGVSAMIFLSADNFYPMSTEESLDYFGVTLPEGGIDTILELTGGGCFGDRHGVYRSEGHVYFDVNSYEFTGNGKRVILTLRRLFNMTPSPQQVANGPEPIEFMEIRGWELALFRYTDEDGTQCVYTEFVLDGVTYTISASGLGDNELMLALISFLPQKAYSSDPSGPVTVTGTVTHVDSRKSDYFDGTEHHYSEDHDYITVDCGDTHLTVWLPGEANRFSIGDCVTVTYHGEPATAYNIWPGQLVSVE